jgi:hypothetical protein
MKNLEQRFNEIFDKALEGYKVMPPMDKDKYPEMPGLEGPFTLMSGKVVYYDPKEGAYYDKDTDMYMSYDEFQQHDNDYSNMKDERDDVKEVDKSAIDAAVAQAMSGAPQSSPRPKARPKRIPRPKARPTINIGSNPETGATRGIDPKDNYSPEDLKRLLMQGAMEDMNKARTNEVRTMPLDSIDWPDSNMLQTATDAIRYDYTTNDAFSHLYSMHGDDHGKWLRANEDDILAMFSQYSMDESISEDEAVAEGDGRKKGIHGKGHPMRKAQQAAIHANEGKMSDSIIDDSETMSKEEFTKKHGKEMADQYFESKLQDMRKALKLSESTDANTVVAQYTRATLDQTHNTWNKVCEQIDHIRSFVKEDVDVNNVRLQIRKMHEQEGLDHKIQIKENVGKLRQIVKGKSAMSIKFADGSMKVDMTTASIFLQVFDKVKEETQAKIVDKIQTKTGFLSMLELMYKKIG